VAGSLKGCEKVAGGRSTAQTPGLGRLIEFRTPRGAGR